MKRGRITASVISCPGDLGNETFSALQLNVEGFRSPYVLTLVMRAIGYNALAEQADPGAVFNELASAVNHADICVDIAVRHAAASGRVTRATCANERAIEIPPRLTVGTFARAKQHIATT